MGEMVSKAGFYDGKFRKAGQYHNGPRSDDLKFEKGGGTSVDLGTMTKDELLAEAEKRGVEVKASDTKADILGALKG